MDESIEGLDQLVTELPLVRPDTIEMVITHLMPEDDYYLDKIEYMAMTNNRLYNFIDNYSRNTDYPNETIHTALLAYSLLEEEAGIVPVITKIAADQVKKESLGSVSEQTYATPILHRMRRNNPHYFNALYSYINTSKDHVTNWITVAFVYRLFEKQAELNKLKIN